MAMFAIIAIITSFMTPNIPYSLVHKDRWPTLEACEAARADISIELKTQLAAVQFGAPRGFNVQSMCKRDRDEEI